MYSLFLDSWGRTPQAIAATLIVSCVLYLAYKLRAKTAPRSAIVPLQDFTWSSAEPYKLRPFKPAYHITMALQNSTPSELITMDNKYLTRVAARRAIIQKHGSTVHGCLPEGVPAVRELYTFLFADYLPARFPTMFRLSGKNLHNLVTGKTFSTAAPEPLSALRAIGETVEEDVFLLEETPEGHRAVAFMCCFPSGFDPSQKFGKNLKAIHAPVPSYEKIGASMERVFTRLEVGKSVKRMNWSVQTHGELFACEGQHITNPDADMSVDENVDINKTHLRVELQTLTRLPQTRAILFSFHTYMDPISDLKNEGLGPAFADAIEGLKTGNAPGMWTYKSSVKWGKRVCEYLRS